MDSSESKDGIEAGANSPSRPWRCRAQSPRRELGRVSPARTLTMSRGELNRERDDASASGGGAGAAPRGRGDGAKVLGGFAGSKNDGEELLTGQRFLAAKGCKNDSAEFLGAGRMFLAAKGSKNDGAEFVGRGQRLLVAKGSRNDGAEAEEVLGAFAGSKMANPVKAAAAVERIDGAVLGALAEKAAAAFFEATPAVPHAVTLTEKRRLPSPSLVRASVSSARSHSNVPQSSKRGRTSSCSGYQCRSMSLIGSEDLKLNELKNAAEMQEKTENELEYDLLWKSVETYQPTEKAQGLAKAEIVLPATEQQAPQYEHMDEAKTNDLKLKELKNAAEVQEKTENELEYDLLWKSVETYQPTEKAQELAKAEIVPAAQKAPQYEHMDEAKTNDTSIATSKGLDASSRESEAVTIPHPLCERATIELVETKKIQDVNSVQNWLIEKELESDENYFMRIGTNEEKKVWQRVRACPNVFGQKFSGRRITSLKIVTNKKDILFLYQQMKRSGSTLDIREIAHPSMQGLSEITKFLCRNCLLRNGKADRVALDMLCEAVKDIADAEAIGDIPGFIATVVLRSYFGNAESQRLSLHILVLLSRRHRNKLKIIQLGGFSFALWHVSQRHAMMGCRLMASLMDAEEGLMKFIKDGASFELVNLTVKTGILTTWISGVIEGLRDFPLGRTKFLEAVGSLPSKEVFVQQRLTWCLLDFVEEDERYCLEDTLED